MENRVLLNKSIKSVKSKVHKVIPYGLIVILAVLTRLLPHPPNFAPIDGLALFSGSKFSKKIAVVIPLAAMVLSDIFLGFHNTIFFVYISFVVIAIMGSFIKQTKWYSLAAASFLSSVIFFLVTNFGVWYVGGLYPKTFSGLIEAYVMGLPFFGNTLLSDFIYSFSFFYGFALLKSREMATKLDV